jgi:hypothetical protein
MMWLLEREDVQHPSLTGVKLITFSQVSWKSLDLWTIYPRVRRLNFAVPPKILAYLILNTRYYQPALTS